MTNANPQSPEPRPEPLSQRESEVLALIVAGLSNHEIADRLVVAYNTVKWYINQLFNKLGVNSRQEAVERAQALGLVGGDAPAPAKHNLPAQVTPFVGRKREVEDITRLLRSSTTRLVTILAPGGMGKTRLAVATARTLLMHFPDGVYIVPLAPLTSPDPMVTTIADVIGFQFAPDRRTPQQQLLAFLRNKQVLLVLDNFEHLLDGTPLVTDLLQAAPHVQLLVTSRERLNLSGESVYTLSGLAYPEPVETEPVMSYSAVQLFVQSAQRTRADFALDAGQDGVVRVCQLVQGMPLALELAAAWVGGLSPAEIAEEITRSLDFLQTRMRDVPERLRSVRAVFESAWARLTEPEQAVFRRLSVFRGGCTRAAAEAVTGADVMTLTALVDKAVLRRDPVSGRYQVHELLRQYAEEELSEAPKDEAHTRRLHSRYFANRLQQKMSDVREEDFTQADFYPDLDNTFAGVLYAIRQHLVEEIAAYAEGLWEYFEAHGWYPIEAGLIGIYRDAIAVMEQDAEQREGSDSPNHPNWVLFRLYESLGTLLHSGRYYDEAKRAFEQALQHGLPEDKLSTARLQRKLGNVYVAQRVATELVQSVFHTAELALGSEPVGDSVRWWREWIQIQLDVGWVYYLHSKIYMMTRLVEKAATAIEQYGTPAQRSKLFSNRTLLELRRHMFHNLPEDTLYYARASLEAARQAGAVWEVSWLQFSVGFVHLWRDEFEEAEQYFLTALEHVEQAGDSMGTLPTILAYLPVIYRRWQHIDEVEKWARMGIKVATETNAVTYSAAGNAHMGWVYLRRGALADAKRACETALLQWATQAVPYPFRWFADAPLLAVAVEMDQVEQAIGFARDLLDPRYQPLLGELPDLLRKSVNKWEENDPESSRAILQAFCAQSARLGYG